MKNKEEAIAKAVKEVYEKFPGNPYVLMNGYGETLMPKKQWSKKK